MSRTVKIDCPLSWSVNIQSDEFCAGAVLINVACGSRPNPNNSRAYVSPAPKADITGTPGDKCSLVQRSPAGSLRARAPSSTPHPLPGRLDLPVVPLVPKAPPGHPGTRNRFGDFVLGLEFPDHRQRQRLHSNRQAARQRRDRPGDPDMIITNAPGARDLASAGYLLRPIGEMRSGRMPSS
jgi:hypothetical protein